MFHLVYTSHARAPYTQEDLIDLLRQSRAHNVKQSITGMLLYLNGKFIQVLEGNKENVQALFERICQNPRHTRVMKVMEGNSRTRLFKDWSMGFKQLTDEDFETITGYKDIDAIFSEDRVYNNGNLLMTFLTLFYKKNITDYAELPSL